MEFDWEDAVNWTWTTAGGIKFRIRVEEDGVVALLVGCDNPCWSRWAEKDVVARYMSAYKRVEGSNDFCGPRQNPIIVKIKLMETRRKKYQERKQNEMGRCI